MGIPFRKGRWFWDKLVRRVGTLGRAKPGEKALGCSYPILPLELPLLIKSGHKMGDFWTLQLVCILCLWPGGSPCPAPETFKHFYTPRFKLDWLPGGVSRKKQSKNLTLYIGSQHLILLQKRFSHKNLNTLLLWHRPLWWGLGCNPHQEGLSHHLPCNPGSLTLFCHSTSQPGMLTTRVQACKSLTLYTLL